VRPEAANSSKAIYLFAANHTSQFMASSSHHLSPETRTYVPPTFTSTMTSSPPFDLELMLSPKKEARNLQVQLIAFEETRSVFTSPETHGSRTRRDGVRRGSNRTRDKYLRDLKVSDPERYLQLMQALADKDAADAGDDVDEPSADVQDDIGVDDDDDSGTQLSSVLTANVGDDWSTQLSSVLTADVGDDVDCFPAVLIANVGDDSNTQLPSVLASDAGDDDDSSTKLPSVRTADVGDDDGDEVVRVCCCVRFFALFLF